MGECTISTREYCSLLECKVRIEVFAEHVRKKQWSVDREECARFLGFELEEAKEDEEPENGTN